MLRIDVLTIFPEFVTEGFNVGVIGRGVAHGLLDLRAHDLRQETTDVHQTVDAAPFGGGAGMVMKPEPVFDLLDSVNPPRPLIYMGPAGRPLTQEVATELAELEGFTLLCGRYEGIDQRILDHAVDDVISVGDVVLAGGEIAALTVVEAVGRLVPGVLGNASSLQDESFSDGLLEYPQYTRPAEYRGWSVPAILTSGDHAKVSRWRRAKALRLTLDRRPDLIVARGRLTDEDQQLLNELDEIEST
ncbi:MAG: tRNA (guanosine(37)-N1)-methyltransferase TrmD [Acidimicrobiia bacterium]|nr:tRNA (guanosine(37)-N1)-methyltransferase TrmD [Acidimicrobiia bacterium]